MTTNRIDGSTPAGGSYAIATWVDLKTLVEVDRDAATGIVIAEYDADDRMLFETVGEVIPQRAAATTQTT